MSILYNWFIEFYKTWTNFIQNAGNAQQIAQKFKEDFTSLGFLIAFLVLLITGIGFAFYYYFGYNKLPGFKYRRMHWWIFMGITAGSILLLTLLTVFLSITPKLNSEPYFFLLSLINSIYGVILYFILSLFLKKYSNAKRTPF